MEFSTTQIPYQQTGQFSKIITDYLDNAAELRDYYAYPVNFDGIRSAIEARNKFPVDRKLLTRFLSRAYSALEPVAAVAANIELLKQDNTFTVVTAHQPNIFTGHLYFVYKILHVVKLAAELNEKFPTNRFVPVFYMGSEDADLEELGHIFVNGEKLEWDTTQKGAVGRMSTRGLEKLISRLSGELKVFPHGNDLIALLQDCYKPGVSIQQATFQLVHALFGRFGLITVVPDDPELKATMSRVFEDDLMNQTASSIVSNTIASLGTHYKVQAQPREINLFYLKDDIRERIVRQGNQWRVTNTDLTFSEQEIRSELEQHPERFSPNVILRGLFQETILPDVAFIGGGGETAYWLELHSLFKHYNVFFPMLVLRNSFLLIEERWKQKMEALELGVHDIFSPESELLKQLVKRRSAHKLHLSEELEAIGKAYDAVQTIASTVDITLSQHVQNLRAKTEKKLRDLEHKMMRAEKRKFADESRQLNQLKTRLFPSNGLQERTENLLPYFAKYGPEFLDIIFKHSQTLDQQFAILTEMSAG